MRQITEHTILAMPDAMKEIEERDALIERQYKALLEADRELERRGASEDCTAREMIESTIVELNART